MTWVLTPGPLYLATANDRLKQTLHKFDIVDEGFKKQTHIDLPAYFSVLLDDKGLWRVAVGSLVVAMTYSPLRGMVAGMTTFSVGRPDKVTEIMLHVLTASTDPVNEVAEFFKQINP